MTSKELLYIQNKIGYTFKKENLLLQAFTRRSYSIENQNFQHNQVLEFFGDSVLKFCIMKNLSKDFGSFNKYNQFVSSQDEGKLTEKRKSLENKDNLSKCIDNLDFAKFLLLGKADENNNVRNKVHTKEDLFESILGAVALDCNFDIEKMNSVCKTMLETKSVSEQKKSSKNDKKISQMRNAVGKPQQTTAVTKLNELNQKGYISKPKYGYKQSKSGWTCYCSVAEHDTRWYNSTPQNKKSEARQIAAYWLLMDLLGYDCT